MTAPAAPSKVDLLDALRRTGEEFAENATAMPASAWDEGRYENGWNARQILAHVASIEWTYARLIDMAANPPPPREGPPPPRQESPAQSNPIVSDYNERQVAKRADAGVADLLQEFRKNRAATIAAVEKADDALLAKEVASAGGARGPLASVIDFVAVQHVRMHLRDILGEVQI
jgi:hypothetical protein